MKRIQRSCTVLWALFAMGILGCSGSTDGHDSFEDVSADSRLETDVSVEDVVADADVEPYSDATSDSLALLDAIPAGIDPDSLVLDPNLQESVVWPEGVRVRVMTFNIYGEQWGSAEAIGKMIVENDVTLVGLQECSSESAQAIAEAAGMDYVYGAGDPILSRVPLIDPETVSLDGSRSFTRAKVDIDGTRLAFYNAHIGWNLDGNRQFRTFVDEHLALETLPRVVITGDFNDEHLSTQNTILEEWGTDAFTAAQIWPGERISWPSIGFDETEGSQLIDLVWFRKTFPALVISAAPLNLSPVLSDHKPVVVELLFPTGDEPFGEDPAAAMRDEFSGFPPEGEWPENLLSNPGAESGLDGWETQGDARVLEAHEHQTARSGEGMFAGFAEAPADGSSWSSGSQTVNLEEQSELIADGRGLLWVSGFLCTGFQVEEEGEEWSNIPKPMDDGELIVEVRTADGAWSALWHSGRLDTLKWHPVAATLPLPVNTQAARLTWMTHQRPSNGPSNDAFFDDLYLGFGEASQPHGQLTGNLLPQGSFDNDSTATPGDGWTQQPDLHPLGSWGIYPFAPWGRSGRGFLVGSTKVGGASTYQAPLLAEFPVDVSALASSIDVGTVALRWGGWMRSYNGEAEGQLSLVVLQQDGTEYAVLQSDPVLAAEWTGVEKLTLLPPGARSVVLRIKGEMGDDDEIYVDELFVRAELTKF